MCCHHHSHLPCLAIVQFRQPPGALRFWGFCGGDFVCFWLWEVGLPHCPGYFISGSLSKLLPAWHLCVHSILTPLVILRFRNHPGSGSGKPPGLVLNRADISPSDPRLSEPALPVNHTFRSVLWYLFIQLVLSFFKLFFFSKNKDTKGWYEVYGK